MDFREFDRCSTIYVDESILLDECCASFFAYLAARYCEIRLCVHDVWHFEEIKQNPHLDYICDVIYGEFLPTVLVDRQQRGNNKNWTVVIGHIPSSKAHNRLIQIGLGETEMFANLEDFLTQKYKKDKALQMKLGICIASSMIVIAICGTYGEALDFPTWLVVLFAISIMTFIMSIFYGLCKRAFRVIDVLDIF